MISLLDIAAVALLAGVSAYRLTRLIVHDEILRSWRERHWIAMEGYRCDDTWYPTYQDGKECVPEFRADKGYREVVEASSSLPWPIKWIKVLFSAAFWKRVFSCEQCASVWIAGVLAGIWCGVAAVIGSWHWLLLWPLVGLAAAGIAAWMSD